MQKSYRLKCSGSASVVWCPRSALEEQIAELTVETLPHMQKGVFCPSGTNMFDVDIINESEKIWRLLRNARRAIVAKY